MTSRVSQHARPAGPEPYDVAVLVWTAVNIVGRLTAYLTSLYIA